MRPTPFVSILTSVLTTRFATSPDLFKATCGSLLTRMLDTVPAGVELSEVIEPLPIKPQDMVLTFMGDGTLQLTGTVRVRSPPSPPHSPL